ncbi:hypothetical protein [Rhizobium oryzicola]|uniref:Uncharacterized protein n=1 Tax=Rhizobium oryzicola TaxID=1232668 RepID=A0ABT8T1B0_9HYPH|nr:hypothetical protein [Rhizobium oryzicola]MDO1584315.1 hypothetical protein [Rhizobium oryzicola]
MKGVKLRLSRTFVLVFGGVVLLVGGSGAAALYFAGDKFFGPSYEEVNGLTCTTLQQVKIKRDQRYWVRKYVMAEHGDGVSRVKTAIRVAKAVQAAEKADLVQVTVLDKSGPTQRSEMRGRAIGAQVVYIPDPSRAPEPTDVKFTAYYVDGNPTAKGEFYGLRRDLPIEDVEKLAASLTDSADCVQPVVAAPAEGHGGKKGKEEKSAHGGGESHGKESEGKGKEGAAHGEEKPAEGAHGEKPAEGHEAPAAKEESGGLISSLTSMIFGGSKEAPASGEAHGANGNTDVAHAADPNQPSGEHTAVAEQPGFFGRMKAMIFGGDKAVAAVAPAAHEPVVDKATQDDHTPQEKQPAAPAHHDGIDPMKVSAPTDEPAAPPPAISHAAPPAEDDHMPPAPAKAAPPAKPKATTVSH